ncbi:MAG: dependent oxidoreductase, partial [Verrucomicrobiaceae bacterium]|nr:dependent oxidoreductase [Verrucomicrobiaceae bacterium]
MPIFRHLLAFALSSTVVAAAAEPDVLVYSGVPCGIASAIAAAREGANVLLVEPNRHIGGLSTSGINTAETEHMLKWTIGGIAIEFYERLGKEYGTGHAEFYFESSVAEKVYLDMLREAGVAVRYGLRVEKVAKDGTRIRSVTLSDGSEIHAKVFVDAGYEGDLMARAGVNSVFGRDSKAEYGEEAAGIRFDKTARHAATVDDKGNLLPGISGWVKDLKEGDAHPGTMNYNFRLTFAKNPTLQAPIPQPQNYDRHRYALLENWLRGKQERKEKVKLDDLLDFYARRNGKYEVNNKQAAIFSIGHFGGQFGWPDASYEKRDKIIADHWDYTLGLLKFLAEDESVPENVRREMKAWGLHKEEFKDNGYLPY